MAAITLTMNGAAAHRPAGADAARGGPASMASTFRPSVTWTDWSRWAAAGCAWSRCRASPPGAGLPDRGPRGDGGDHRQRRPGRVPANDRRTAAGGTHPHLRGLRSERQLRTADAWRRGSGSTTCASTIFTSRCGWMPAASASPSTITAASSACAACGSAMPSKAPIPGMCAAAGSPAGSSPTWTALGGEHQLHRLRQMRAALPHRRPVQKGGHGRRDGQGARVPAAHPRAAPPGRRRGGGHDGKPPDCAWPRPGWAAAPAAT